MTPLDASRTAGSTSTSLIARARARQREAWEELVQRYAPLVYHWCRQSQLQPADAADVVQEVFRSVAAGLDSFGKDGRPGEFRGWLRVITRSRVVDHFRRRTRQPQGVGGTTHDVNLRESVPDGQLLLDEPPEVTGQHDKVHRALDALRDEIESRTWQVFWRTTVEDQPAADVARDLGLSIGAVYQAKSRTLARLRQILAAASDE